MGNSDIGLEIAFPSSDEDHRLQLVGINGSVFAILHRPLESDGPIHLNCEDWSLILLAPIKSKKDVVITGVNVISLSTIESEEASVTIEASNQLVNISPSVKSALESSVKGKSGEYRLDDPGIFLNYFQMFNKIVSGAREASPESLAEAQKRIITVLCTLAEKIEGKAKDMNIHRVLGIWDIPTEPPKK